MNANYVSGFAHGFIAAVIICYVVGRMSKASGTIKRRRKPLDTFPDAAQPHLTPAKIVRESTLAMLAWLFWLIILVITVILMVLIAFQMQHPATV